MQLFDSSDVKAYMGHADISTTMIYVHHVPQDDAAGKRCEVVAKAEGPVIRNAKATEKAAARQEAADPEPAEPVSVPFRDTFGTRSRMRCANRAGKWLGYGAFRVGPPGFEPGTNGFGIRRSPRDAAPRAGSAGGGNAEGTRGGRARRPRARGVHGEDEGAGRKGGDTFSAINRALGPTAGAEISTLNAKALLATSGTRSTS